MLNDIPHSDLADEMVAIIWRIGTGRTPENIRALVYTKVAGLTAQEPFYLRSVLNNPELDDFQKAGAFTGLRTWIPGQPRYPEDYHMSLKKNTQLH